MSKLKAILVLLMFSSLVMQGCGTKTAAAPIKIGVMYNLDGAQASIDIPSYNGAKLAAKEVNQDGGVRGRKIELDFYDGMTDPHTIGQDARRLVGADHVTAIIGFSDSNMVLAAAPIAAEAKTVFITSGATSPKLPEQVPDYLFLACFGDNVQAAAGAEYAYNDLGLKTSAVLEDQGTDYTLLLARYFQERFTEMRGQIAQEDKYTGGATDFSRQIRRLKSLDPPPDMIYISSGPDDIGTIVKQVREAGLSMPIVGGDGYDTPLLVQKAGKDATDIYFTTHVFLNEVSGTQRVRTFMAAYKSEYGTSPDSAFAALGYDTVNLLADALGRAQSDNASSIISALLQTRDFPAVTGDISYEDGSRIPLKSVTVVKIDNGVRTLAAVVTPQKVPAP